jgi:hypothetical protein
VPATESGDANNGTAEGPEEHENVSGGTDWLYETVQKVIAAMRFLAASSAVLSVVFFIQAIRYHSPFMTFLALWFLVMGSQAYIIFEVHRVDKKMEEHCCDGTDNSVNMILWSILAIALFLLPTYFIWTEPVFVGKFGAIESYVNVATITLTVFLTIIWVLDTVYMIYEVMPIRID